LRQPFPLAHFSHLLNGLFKAAAGDGGHIGNFVSAHLCVFKAQRHRVDPQGFGRHVHLNFRGVQGLGRSETAHGAGGRFVGIGVTSVKPIVGIPVQHGAEITAEKGGRRSHGIVGPAVQNNLKVFGDQASVLFKPHFGMKGHGVTSSPGQKFLLPCEGEFHGTCLFVWP
jgi:hypothetical protein